jgi:hypothetical protein
MRLYELVLTPKDPHDENLFWYVVATDAAEILKTTTLPHGYLLEQVKLIAKAPGNLILPDIGNKIHASI